MWNRSPVQVGCMRQGAQGWCTGMTLRDGMGREVGGRVRMGDTCTPMVDHVNVWQKTPQSCQVISLQLKLKKQKTVLFFRICPEFFQWFRRPHGPDSVYVAAHVQIPPSGSPTAAGLLPVVIWTSRLFTWLWMGVRRGWWGEVREWKEKLLNSWEEIPLPEPQASFSYSLIDPQCLSLPHP